MKRLINRLVAGVVLVSALGAAARYGLHWWSEVRRTESTDNA